MATKPPIDPNQSYATDKEKKTSSYENALNSSSKRVEQPRNKKRQDDAANYLLYIATAIVILMALGYYYYMVSTPEQNVINSTPTQPATNNMNPPSMGNSASPYRNNDQEMDRSSGAKESRDEAQEAPAS